MIAEFRKSAALAALAEIAGCFSFWAWARLGKSALWLAPGMVSLAAFAWVLGPGDSGLPVAAGVIVLRRLTDLLKSGKIVNVFFTEFILQ